MKKAIDDDSILNSYYDDRETFVVDYDSGLIDVELDTYSGTVIFKLKVNEK